MFVAAAVVAADSFEFVAVGYFAVIDYVVAGRFDGSGLVAV